MKKLSATAMILVMFAMIGCSTSLDTYRDKEPHLKLEEFFNGELVAYGMVQDYSGEVIQRFRVDLVGSWEGNEGVLDETFYYADGREQKRIWYITKTAPDQYEGRASDVEGVAKGKVAGNVLNWSYVLTIELDGEPFSVKLDDWLYLVDEDNMINRTHMYKYGINVGEITLYIGKK
ncbi:DUF3833 domain-containing protein [Pseudidiomarina terrestris]|uniref:DUF3833 domain-containing protein n=1 Tax=Pseudidiomarina terrestris TaxID=2820060 RepID=UPI0026520694|nr:DUF3833 domain-containing protein [Pseudidiomarina sp. 1ASP75-5]MDN7135293.1 DUF3833 domain-containing protein [Pseudidiomarina sp. 1ASP75-5]